MNKLILILVTLFVIVSLIFTGCGGGSEETTSTTPPTTPTATPTPTPTPKPTPEPEPTSWFDATPYLGIPSAECKEPVTDLDGLPPAAFNLTVDSTKQVGTFDNAQWSNIGTALFYCALGKDNWPALEINRQAGTFKYMRLHDIFSDGIGKWFFDFYPEFISSGVLPSWYDISSPNNDSYLYTEDENGNPKYNFWNLDAALDTMLSAGIKPIIPVCMMPEALAEGEKLRLKSGFLINTPNDYNKWRELCYQTVKHCIERYGVEEVRTWYWELWSEPDTNGFFIDAGSSLGDVGDWTRYLKMYDYFADGIKAADAQIKIGGPVAGTSEWVQAFCEHCVNGVNAATGGIGAPVDFIVWHDFDNIERLAARNRDKMAIIKQYPSLKDLPIVEDEWGQPHVMMDAQGQIISDKSLSEEEFTNHEAAYVCKFIDTCLTDPANQPDVLARAGWLSSQTGSWRYFSMALMGYFIPMPILNEYILMAKMGKERVELTGSSYGDAVHGYATRTSSGVQVLLYNFNETDRYSEGVSKEVDLTITGLSEESTTMKRYLIDNQNSNPWTGFPFEVDFWKTPQSQLPQMQENSKLKITEQSDNLKVSNGQVTLRLTMPPNSVTLVVVGEEAAPPVFSPSPHIARVIQEESAYKAAKAKLDLGDFNRAKAGFEQLAADSFAAVTDESSNNTYSLWGQKALWALLDIAKNRLHDYSYADEIRLRLLATTLTDVQKYVLLNERLVYLGPSGSQDELQAITAEIQALRIKFEYFNNWTKFTRNWDESF